MTTIEIISALLQAAQALTPALLADFQAGTVTPAQQAALQAAIANLQINGFSGPEWQVTVTSTPPTP